MTEPFVPLGKLVTTHGLDGWLKLNPFNPDTTALVPGAEVFVENAGGRSSMTICGSRLMESLLLTIRVQVAGSVAHRRGKLIWFPA